MKNNFSENLLNALYNKQKFIELFAILLVFLSIGFSFGDNTTKWFWSDYPFIGLFLVIISLLLSILWVRIEKYNTQKRINEIINSNKSNSSLFDKKINLLTKRQKEIFDLILKEKSNKEIMKELYIELSTLKTHINHIYKTLQITNRKQAKAIGKSQNIDKIS